MLRRGDHDEGLLEEHLGLDVGVVHRQGDDGEVEAAVVELGEQRGGGGVDDDDVDPGVVAVDGLEQAGR